jgi:proteasome lid subunit RPN8/RPN11
MKIPKKLKAATIKQIMRDAEHRYPREACGVIVIDRIDGHEHYLPCKNLSTDPTEEFVLCPDSFAEAEACGDVVGIVHSHPDATTRPSAHDIAVMSRNREVELIVDPDSKPIPWHIVSWPEGDYRQVIPEVSESLLGKPFVHGVWDCWATCESYYRKYHGIEFPKYVRKDRWWEEKETTSFYEEFHEEAGFYRVDDLKPGDMIVMQIGRSYHPNHAGIYLGEMSEFEGQKLFGKTLMLHHMYGKNSEVIVYGGQWHQRTRMILRHKEVRNV